MRGELRGLKLRHIHSGYYYCRRCADLINRACGEDLVVSE